MRQLNLIHRNRSGASALEFALVAPLFILLMFAIVDLGRYLLTQHSLDTLASATARNVVIQCGQAGTHYGKLAMDCASATYKLTDTQSQQAAPFLYVGGQTPQVSITCPNCGNTGQIKVIASLPSFTFFLPWPNGTQTLIGALSQTATLYY